jgi:hypothetical protein
MDSLLPLNVSNGWKADVPWAITAAGGPLMFDATGAFTRQFKPIEGGYVYYPSRKAGGKLVTYDEYERLVAAWQKVAGRRGQLKIVGVLIAFILLWTIVSQALTLPDWTEWVMIAVCVLCILIWFFWASFAPRRLASGRPDITQPRSLPEAKREARALLNWRFVLAICDFRAAVQWRSSFQHPELTEPNTGLVGMAGWQRHTVRRLRVDCIPKDYGPAKLSVRNGSPQPVESGHYRPVSTASETSPSRSLAMSERKAPSSG